MSIPTRLSYLKTNLITSSSMLSSSDTRAGYSVSDLINENVWDIWRSNDVSGTKEILISFSSSQDVTFLGLANHNLTSSGTYVLSYGSSPSCSDGSATLNMTSNNFCYFSPSSLNYKYFKFSMNESLSDGYMEIGELELGKHSEVEFNPVIPIRMLYDVEEEAIVTGGGQKWSYRKYTQKGWEMTFIEDYTRAAYASLEDLWENKRKDIPFFLCPQPNTHPEDVLYVRIESFDFRVDSRDSRPGTIIVREAK
jgi:hypothetical protein